MTSRCASSNTTSRGMSSPPGIASAAGGISSSTRCPGRTEKFASVYPRALDADAARLDQRLDPRAGEARPGRGGLGGEKAIQPLAAFLRLDAKHVRGRAA